jgi:glycosyltransferase involved in cell wall biosynthesis
MKIIYFAYSVLNRGGDRVVLGHLEHLAASGHQVTIKANIIDTIFPIYPSIRIEQIKLPSALGTILTALFQKQSADCIIASIIPTATSLFMRNPHRIIYLAQEYEEVAYTSFIFSLFLRVLYFLGLNVFKIPTIAVSNALAQFLEHRSKADIYVVTNGVDTTIYYPDPSEELLAIKNNISILVFASKDRRKGFDAALAVIDHLKNTFCDPFELWIVGDDIDIRSPSCVSRYLGFVDQDHMRKIMSSADVFLYPPRTEGFGLIVAEAFACKCPVVTTSAVPIAKNNINALVSRVDDVEDLADKLKCMLTNTQTRNRLVSEAYLFASQHTIKDSAASFQRKIVEIVTDYD